MMRRTGLGAGLLVLLALIAAAASAAPLPYGPRLSFVVWETGEPMELKLETASADGRSRTTLAGEGRIWPLPFSGGSWSPDGSALVFAGGPRNEEGAHGQIYLVPADGGGLAPVPGTREGYEPVFSPDGRMIAFSRTKLEFKIDFKHLGRSRDYFSTTAWLVDLASGQAKRLTPWRNGYRVTPTSFSPDSARLLVEREQGQGEEVAVLDLASGRMKPLARQAHDAAYSPDGSRIALISERDHVTIEGGDGPVTFGELYVVAADGSHWQRLTRNGTREEEAPSWDPSGQRLAFAQSTGPGTIGFGLTNVIAEINADGSCLTRVVGRPRSEPQSKLGLYAPAWRPGPGRAAGPIAC
jgi:Tol biopolymer transport system component